MRTKEQILNDSQAKCSEVPQWDTIASLHEQLTIEVLIDIRDILDDLSQSIGSNIIDLARES